MTAALMPPVWPARALIDDQGQVVYADPRCDAICDATSGGSCFTPWCRCSCHLTPNARRADWSRSDLR